MWKTYILTRLSRTCDSGAAGGEGSLDLRVGPLWPEHPTKAGRTAMRQATPHQHQRRLVGLLAHRVVHLRMKTRERLAVQAFVLLGLAEVLGKRGLRLAQIGRLLLHLLPRFHLVKRHPEPNLLHPQRNVMRIKWEHEGK